MAVVLGAEDADAPAAAEFAAAVLPFPLLEADPVLRRYDDCFTRPGLMVVAAALALEEGDEAEAPLPLLLEAVASLRRYEDRFTRPGVTPVVSAEPVSAAGGDAAPSRGSFDAHGGEGAASAERGELVDGDPAFLLTERGEDPPAAAAAAAFRASKEDTLGGDDGPL